MNVLLFGATGMIGQGVLRECLIDPGVDRVLAIGRSVTGQHHAKLREIAHKDPYDLAPVRTERSGDRILTNAGDQGISEAIETAFLEVAAAVGIRPAQSP